MIITWLLIVLIAVAILLFVGGIFGWFAGHSYWWDNLYSFAKLAYYVVLQLMAEFVLVIMNIFCDYTWIDSAMVTILPSMVVTAILTFIAYKID